MKTAICYDCRTKHKLSERQITSGFTCPVCGNKNLSIKDKTEPIYPESKINGYVYVAKNPNIRGLKIGYTDRLPEHRMKELSSETGVPGKFVLLHAEASSTPSKLETQIHQALRGSNFSKEFFDISPEVAIETVQRIAQQLEAANREKVKRQTTLSPQIKKYFGKTFSWEKDIQFSEFSSAEPRCRKILLKGEYIGSIDLDGKDSWQISIKPLHSVGGQRRLGVEHLLPREIGRGNYYQSCFRNHEPKYKYSGKISATSLSDTTLKFLKEKIVGIVSFSTAAITFDIRHLEPTKEFFKKDSEPNMVVSLGSLPVGNVHVTEKQTGFFTKTTEYISWHAFSQNLIGIAGKKYGSEAIENFSISSRSFDYLEYVQSDEFQLDCAVKFQYELETRNVINFLIDDK